MLAEFTFQKRLDQFPSSPKFSQFFFLPNYFTFLLFAPSATLSAVSLPQAPGSGFAVTKLTIVYCCDAQSVKSKVDLQFFARVFCHIFVATLDSLRRLSP